MAYLWYKPSFACPVWALTDAEKSVRLDRSLLANRKLVWCDPCSEGGRALIKSPVEIFSGAARKENFRWKFLEKNQPAGQGRVWDNPEEVSRSHSGYRETRPKSYVDLKTPFLSEIIRQINYSIILLNS
jgi:hypothetical protein